MKNIFLSLALTMLGGCCNGQISNGCVEQCTTDGDCGPGAYCDYAVAACGDAARALAHDVGGACASDLLKGGVGAACSNDSRCVRPLVCLQPAGAITGTCAEP